MDSAGRDAGHHPVFSRDILVMPYASDRALSGANAVVLGVGSPIISHLYAIERLG